MSHHDTRKSSRAGRERTLRIKQARTAKYAGVNR